MRLYLKETQQIICEVKMHTLLTSSFNYTYCASELDIDQHLILQGERS